MRSRWPEILVLLPLAGCWLTADEVEQARQMEEQAVITSLENLMSFPFVEERVNAGTLSLHGLWTDIGDASLAQFSGAELGFVKL